MSRIVLVNKPYGMLSQFTGTPGVPTLSDIIPIPDIYPAGRLDADSEGLLVLTDDGRLQSWLTDPARKTAKLYWAQVEGIPAAGALQRLEEGVILKDGPTRRARASLLDSPPSLWQRPVPVRFRKAIPTTWMAIEITEGRNRQVRRMTAAVGHPTLRLVRVRVGPWSLDELAPGQFSEVDDVGLQPDDYLPASASPTRQRKKPAQARAFAGKSRGTV